jgi:hypothetical protein
MMRSSLDGSTWSPYELNVLTRWVPELLFGTPSNPANPHPEPAQFRRERFFHGSLRIVPVASLAAVSVGSLTPSIQAAEELILYRGDPLPRVTLLLNGVAPTIAPGDVASRHRLGAYRAMGATHAYCVMKHA